MTHESHPRGSTLCLRCYDQGIDECACPAGTVPECPRCKQPPRQKWGTTDNPNVTISCECVGFKRGSPWAHDRAVKLWRDTVFTLKTLSDAARVAERNERDGEAR